ncbi:hypothetical protein [Vibrio coralliilyticus]|nr:hypothetical protein [Vibrio coralliilyticus]
MANENTVMRSKTRQVLDAVIKIRRIVWPSVHGRIAILFVIAGISMLGSPVWVVFFNEWMPSIARRYLDLELSPVDLERAESQSQLLGFVCASLGVLIYFAGEYLFVHKRKQRVFIYLANTLKERLPETFNSDEAQYIERRIVLQAEAGDASSKQLLSRKEADLTEFINVLLKNSSTERNFNYVIAKLFYSCANLSMAKEYCTKEVHLHRDNYEAHLFLASIYEHEGNKDRAIRLVEEIIPNIDENKHIDDLIHALIFHWHLDSHHLKSLERAKALAMRHNVADKLARILFYLGQDIDLDSSEETKFWCDIEAANQLIDSGDFVKARLKIDHHFNAAYDSQRWLEAEYINRIILNCYQQERDHEMVYQRLQIGLELTEKSGCVPSLISNMIGVAESLINPDDPNPKRFDPEKALEIWESLLKLGHKTNNHTLIDVAKSQVKRISEALAEVRAQQVRTNRINQLKSMLPTDPSDSFFREFIQLAGYGLSSASSLFIQIGQDPKCAQLYKKMLSLYDEGDEQTYLQKTLKLLFDAGFDNQHPQLISQSKALDILEQLISASMKKEESRAREFLNNTSLDLSPLGLMKIMSLDLPDEELSLVTEWLDQSQSNLNLAAGRLVASCMGHSDALPTALAEKILSALSVEE